jgi:hypothetical protein
MKHRLTTIGTLACLEARHLELAEHYEAEGRLNEAREQRLNLVLVREQIKATWRGLTP